MTAPLCHCGHSRLNHDRRHGECSAQIDAPGEERDGDDCGCEGYGVPTTDREDET